MKGPTIKVKLTSDSYKKWIKWQKNFGELLTRAEQEKETGFLLIINVKKNYGYATLLGCDGALLAAKGISPAVSRFHHNANGENDGRKKRGNQHEAAARRDASRLCVDYKCSNRARGKAGESDGQRYRAGECHDRQDGYTFQPNRERTKSHK